VTRKATTKTTLSTWQQEAIASLRAIASQHPGTIEVITATPAVRDGDVSVTIRLPAKDLPAGPGGL
jgi:hypothetical protein